MSAAHEEPRRAVVVGGAGFIGAHLASALLQRGDHVVLYDSLARAGSAHNLHWLRSAHAATGRLELVQADVRDADRLARVVAGAEQVYHLGGQVAVTRSLADPRADFEVNALGTLNVLEAARRSPRPPCVLYTSTNKVYGALDDCPVEADRMRYRYAGGRTGIDERRPLDPHSPYGCSKAAADQYVRDYARIYGLRTVVLRMSCIYGPHQVGTEDQGWVAHFVISAVERRPLVLCGDGRQVRDLLYVDDLVRVMLRAAERAAARPGEVFNIGGGPGRSLSLLELIERLADLTGDRPRVGFAPWRAGDQRVYISDVDKARRELDWTPEVPVAEGIARLHRWVVHNRDALRLRETSEAQGAAVALLRPGAGAG